MNITNLTVENFKCYKTATTAEFAPITLIYGENGGGKSSLLQALEVMKKSSQSEPHVGLQELKEKWFLNILSKDLNLRFEDSSYMDWVINCSDKTFKTGPASCIFIENIMTALLGFVENDILKLRKGIAENFDNNIKVVSLESTLNKLIKSSNSTYKKYLEIITSQNQIVCDEDGCPSFNFDLRKSFSEDKDVYAFGKGAISSFIEQQNIKPIDCGVSKDLVNLQKVLEGKDLKKSVFKNIGYLEGLNNHQMAEILDKYISLIASFYKFASKLKLNAWVDYDYDMDIRGNNTVFGFSTIFQAAEGFISRSSLSNCVLDTYMTTFTGGWYITNRLKEYSKKLLNENVKEYFSSLCFVDQPRGYAGMLSNPINAKLKRNLTPLLHQMFPEISFDIRTEGEKKDIYIYDDVLDAEVPATECGFGYSQILPILIALADTDNEVVCISEPESHIHPRLQAGIGSLFLDVYRRSGKQIIAETHSEHIVLRIQRLIRCGEMKPQEVSVLYVSKTLEGSTIKRLHLDDKGRFIDAWPQGFFAERDEELFGGKPA